MPPTYNLVFNAQVQVDRASLARSASDIGGAFRGLGGGVTVNTSGATAGLAKVGGAAAAAQTAFRAAQTQANALNATLTGTVTVANQGASSLANLSTQAGLAARRFLAFSLAAGAMVKVVQAIKEGVRAGVEFELSMNKVAQVSTDTGTQLAQLRAQIGGLATSLGVSSAALADSAVTFKQAGLSINQTRDALEAVALVDLAPSFEGQKQATEGLIAAFRQFDLQSKDFKSSLSSINAVAAEFAVESSDIVTAIQKAGGAFKVSAGDMKGGQQALNEFVALFTSVRDTTRESADSIATGLRTVFTRLQRQDTVTALKDLGINLRYTSQEAQKMGNSGLTNQFVGAYEAVRRLSEGLAGLRTTDPRYSQVVEQLGGYRQISRVIPLLQQFETAQKALNVAQAGQISLQVAAEKRQETLAAKTAKLKEEYLDLFRKVVDSKGFQGLAGGLITVASAFAKVIDSARPLLPLLTALAAIKLGTSLGGIVGGFGRSFLSAPGAAVGPKKFATGGVVPGQGNTDSELSLLTPGEFVLNKQAVAKVGVPNLRDLNEGRGRLKISRYATGSREPVGGIDDLLRRKAALEEQVAAERAFQGETRSLMATVGGGAPADAAGVLPQMKSALAESAAALALFEAKLKAVTESLGRLEQGGASARTAPPSEYALARVNQPFAGQAIVPAVPPRLIAPETPEPLTGASTADLRKRLRSNRLIDRLRRAQPGAAVDPQRVDARPMGDEDPFLAFASANRQATAASVADATSAVEAARSRAAVEKALPSAAPASAVASIPADQREQFFKLAQVAIKSAEYHAKSRGRAGESAVAGGDLDDFVTEYFAKNGFPKADLTRGPADINAFARVSGRQAAQAFFSKQGRFTPAGVLDGEVGGREADPAATALRGDPEHEQTKRSRLRARQREQARAALGGSLPETHQEAVEAAKRLGVKSSVAHTATGVNKNSAGSITNVLAGELKDAVGGATIADHLNAIKTGGADPFHPTALDEGRTTPVPPALGGIGQGPPLLPPAPPTTPSPADDSRGPGRNFPKPVGRSIFERAPGLQSVLGVTALGKTSDPYSTDALAARQEAARLGTGQSASFMQAARARSEVITRKFNKSKAAKGPGLYESGANGDLSVFQAALFGRPVPDLRSPEQAAKEAADRAYRNSPAGRFDAQVAMGQSLRRPAVQTGGSGPSVGQTADLSLFARGSFGTGFGSPVYTDGQLARQELDLVAKRKLTQFGGEAKTLTALVSDRAGGLADRRLAARGGAANLSDTTKAAVQAQALAEQETAVRRELISAQKNLLAKLQPQMAALERHTKAVEDVEKALKGEAKVVRDRSGKLLGTKDAVDRATAAGVSAPGAGGAGYFVQSRLGGYVDAARTRLTTPSALAQRGDALLQKPGVGLGLAAAGVGAAYFSDQLDQSAGGADVAASNRTAAFHYTAKKAGSGVLQGGAVGAGAGAAIGSAVPVVGTLVGGLVGAFLGGVGGFIASLSGAEKDIREAKIGNALTEVSGKLSAFATGIPDAAALAGLKGLLDTYDTESAGRARDAADHTFGGVDFGEYRAIRGKDLRKEFGPLLPQISQGLTAQATRLGKDNSSATTGDVDRLLTEMLGRNENGRFLSIAAQLKGTTPADEQKALREALVKGQQAARTEQENRVGKAGVEQNINSFARLTGALQAATDSLSGLQRQASALTDVLDGNINASKVSANADALDQFGRGDKGALQPLDIVAAATGNIGGRLRGAGGAADAVRDALDRVLPTVVANAGVGSADINTEVSRGLYRDLGYADATKAPQDVQRVVNSVLAGLNHAQDGGKGLGGVLDEVKVDGSKFSDTLVDAVAGPVKEFGQKAARSLEDNANRFIDGLTSLHQRLQQVGQLYDQLAQVRGGNFRTELQIDAERAGRGNQALDFASIGQLEQGFDARQQRLAGVDGPRAFDPRALGQQLAEVRKNIGAAVERQQETFKTSGGNSKEFQGAADEVLRLKDRAANLQQALKHLADASERTAVIQEKLNRLKQEEDGRTSLGERFATASPEERVKMNQGFALARVAAERGSLDSLLPDQQRQVVDTLRGAGGVTLSGFQGAPRADDLLKKLIGTSFGGIFNLTGAQQKEKDALQGEQVARGKTAEQAVIELAQHQENGATKFFDTLKTQQNQFFTKLAALLLRQALGDTNNQISAGTVRKRELEETQGRAKDLLGRVGVTTTDQVSALRARQTQLGELRSAVTTKQSAEAAIDAARAALKAQAPRLLLGGAETETGENFLRTNGFADPAAGARIDRRYTAALAAGPVRERLDALYRQAPRGSAAREEGANALAREALDRAIAAERYAGDGTVQTALKGVNDARRSLGGIAGVDPTRVVDIMTGPQKDADDFLKAVTVFDGTSTKIEGFGDRVRQAADELAGLQAQAAKLRADIAASPAPAPATPPVAKANGGSIFRPVGTDTVPAMLTPGEFVVNAKSAKANAGLLHRVNEAKGPVYLANGGMAWGVGLTPEQAEEQDRLRRRQRGGPLTRDEARRLGEFDRAAAARARLDEAVGRRRAVEDATNPFGFNALRPRPDTDPLEVAPAPREKAVQPLKGRPAPRVWTPVEAEAMRNPTGRAAQALAEQRAADALKRQQERGLAREQRQAEWDRGVVSRPYGDDVTVIGDTSTAVVVGGNNSASDARADAARRLAYGRKREAFFQKFGGREKYDALQRQMAGDNAAGNLFAQASVSTFNAASYYANNRSTRPGEDGQRQIAARDIALRGADLDKRFAQSDSLQRWAGRVNAPRRFATGGPVPGAGMGDTVPALLTPGEFVLNQSAVARLGANNVQRFNAGGPVGHVNYLANGGPATTSAGVGGGELKLSSEAVQSMTSLSSAFAQFVQQVGGFSNAATTLGQTFNVFAGNAQALTSAINNMPKTLTIQGTHQVNVVINGAEVMGKLTPEIQQLVLSEVKGQMRRVFEEHMPQAGVHVAI